MILLKCRVMEATAIVTLWALAFIIKGLLLNRQSEIAKPQYTAYCQNLMKCAKIIHVAREQRKARDNGTNTND